jgi:hypothetical protein
MNRNAQSAAKILQQVCAALLVALLFVRPLQMLAETPLPLSAPAAPAPDPEPGMLQITILDGEGALNNIRARTAREPIVEVHDKNHKPVAGVLLFFTIRSGRAGGTFNGSSSFSTYTDANGQAVAHGFMPNNITGRYVITVTAVVGGVTILALIHERNVLGPVEGNSQNQTSNAGGPPLPPPHHHHTGRNVTLVTTVAAVAVVLIVIFTHHSATGITAGGGTVGKP